MQWGLVQRVPAQQLWLCKTCSRTFLSKCSKMPYQPRCRRREHISSARKQTQEGHAGEWAALAQDSTLPDEEDPVLLRSVNEVCNTGIRLMLAGDEGPLIDFRDELSRYGQYFSDSGNMKGALFIYVLYKLTEHVLPPEATKLEAMYLEAFRRLYALLEESGWRVGKEGEHAQEEQSLEQMGYLAG